MKKISAFWTNDGRIFYMKSRVSHKVEANSVTQLNELFKYATNFFLTSKCKPGSGNPASVDL